MTIDFMDMAKEIHDNARKHGWWDEPRTKGEVAALIHSELSEALEEARAGRGNIWYACGQTGNACDGDDCPRMCMGLCTDECRKPEGVCVELIDAVIRMMDYMGCKWHEDPLTDGMIENYVNKRMDRYSIGDRINILHEFLTVVHQTGMNEAGCVEFCAAVIATVKTLGGDWEEILKEKHAYNKNRPYKHGKAF